MSQPNGTRVFAFDNSFGMLCPILRLDPTTGDYKESGKMGYAEGCCAAITAMWIQRTIENGDLTSLAQVGSRHEIELATAAYALGSFSAKQLRNNDDNAIDKLIQARGLRIVTGKYGALGFGRVAPLLRDLAKIPGLYYFHMRRTDGLGHAIGLKFADDGYSLFDPNEGLFKSTNLEEFASRNDSYLFTDYVRWRDGRFLFRQCA